jgi:hypothetical protein
VLAVRDGFLGKDKIRILARNNPYCFVCEDCGNQATGMCIECEDFVCDQCQDTHECGEEMILTWSIPLEWACAVTEARIELMNGFHNMGMRFPANYRD